MSMRDEVRALILKEGPLTADKIIEGTDIEPRKVETMLWQMSNEGHLKKSGEGFATVYALGREKIRHAGPAKSASNAGKAGRAAAKVAKAAKAQRPRPAPRPKAKPAAVVDAPIACVQAIKPNVPKFLPAMAVDGRLIILGHDGPLVFSVEQTEQLAGLLAQHFDAA